MGPPNDGWGAWLVEPDKDDANGTEGGLDEAAQTAQRTSNITEDVTSKVSMPSNSPSYSLEAWERANLADKDQDPRGGKDAGGLTPPISLLLSECIPFSDVAALVAATER